MDVHENSDVEVVLGDSLVSESAAQPPEVIIEQDAYKFMREYAKSDLSREMCGVMLGNKDEQDGRLKVRVKAAIEAQNTEASRASVKFTHASWDYINQVKDREYPDLKVVGWFHTHPGFGIFLSDYDTFIHRNFFNLFWQVAFVLDPVNKKDGCFCWQEDNILPCTYSLDGEKPRRVGIDTPDVPIQKHVDRKRKYLNAAAVAVTTICLLAGAFWAGHQVGIQEQREVATQAEQNMTTASAQKEKSTISNVKVIYRHLVDEGETLAAISKIYYGTASKYDEIAQYNNLDDANVLYPGQVLEIPMEGME